ncbi:MAG: bifunctional diaminohydroxyphosphoribosylaminopyrimidine deaminase/5-amino-6-(5-phosphoribosylamino)uracil reductase RibD [Peptostreptococcaceae bacterium]|nr:bifunctional diaminohydroxyphosphoribosylaminopyrimidine deaminase/5-amino-6-(5-phosphoribosylamino)uracil reductase RibD [Peptostreptococcaceae bacterium]
MKDMEYMKLALELAEKGCGYVNPNPMVGAVIVKNGEIIGSGYHENYGDLHAERNAINSCRVPADGATMYVTLEPCCHYGKTPPCTEAIIRSGIKRVIIGSVDPNPLVAGKGIETLRNNNIEVETGLMDMENQKLNYIFFHYMKAGIPYVVMKYAMTLDGKTATFSGKSKWITGEKAREHVHQSRHKYSGIMVGVNTVIQDDPMLTCRTPNGRNGTRIICDTNLRIPLSSKIIRSAFEVPTYIATTSQETKKIKLLSDAGCKVIHIPKKDGHIDLNILMEKLGKEKMDSILLEGGSTLNFSALENGIINKVEAYISPKIFGGSAAKSPVGGIGREDPDDAFQLVRKNIKIFGEDLLIEYEVVNNVHRDS